MGSNQSVQQLSQEIIDQTIEFGATMAGITRVEDLKKSKSYELYKKRPYYDSFDGLPGWPEEAKSILVFGLQHKRSEPEFDWWDSEPGGTPGNRILINIQKRLKKWLQEEKTILSHISLKRTVFRKLFLLPFLT